MIKKVTISDVEELSKLAKKTFYDTFVNTCTVDDMNSFLEECYSIKATIKDIQDPNRFFYFYTINNKAVGYISFKEGNDGFAELKQFKALELKRLYIEKNFFGKGVAQSLMNFYLSYCIENDYEIAWLGVWEHNERAKTFYKKFGFEDSGYSHPFPIGNTPQTDLWYWKKLK